MTSPKTLACLDPKFPPIEVRNQVLHSCLDIHLLAWAKRLGVAAASKEDAINVILADEFGEKALTEYLKEWRKKKDEWESRQTAERDKWAAAEAQNLASHGMSVRDLAAEAEAKSSPPIRTRISADRIPIKKE